MIHECLGGDFGVDGIVVLELADTCVFGGVNNEGTIAAFGGFVQIEIMPKLFVDSLGARADNGSGIAGGDWVDDGPCGRGKHPMVSHFVVSVGE